MVHNILELSRIQKIFLAFVLISGLIGGTVFVSAKISPKDSKIQEAKTGERKTQDTFISESLSVSGLQEEIQQTQEELKESTQKEKRLKKNIQNTTEELNELKEKLHDTEMVNIFNQTAWYNPFGLYQAYSDKKEKIEKLKEDIRDKHKESNELALALDEEESNIRTLTNKEEDLKYSLVQMQVGGGIPEDADINSEWDINAIERVKKDKIDAFMAENPMPTENLDIHYSGSTSGKGMLVANLPPFILPTEGPITSPFGYRTHPIWGGTRFHSGVDIGVDTGTPIHATNYGLVVFSGWYNGFGETVILSHAEGVYSLYGHNSKLLVEKGEMVSQGQTIALSGSTGNSTGPHCHFSLWNENALVDPLENVAN